MRKEQGGDPAPVRRGGADFVHSLRKEELVAQREFGESRGLKGIRGWDDRIHVGGRERVGVEVVRVYGALRKCPATRLNHNSCLLLLLSRMKEE